ncbi:FecCD family ABC transporter permease [Glycomyces tritici]|uniref:Iron chelate uptake ABC transporter family permease subunit n=1 Tax=Glycomyces tritici TaxID=2665176 RepID=A0ABT7YPF8_9ACTN|nr:iron chelate uptake ABC transporter family permease subunit [Glycomyces tritici]MDN3240523.1 iron chelate uptake ABC transporter family permease subunit [Glycomyces tritici]
MAAVLTVSGQRVSARRRIRLVVAGLALAAIGLFWLAIAIGADLLPPGEVLMGLAGTGEPSTVFIVRELRLPRAGAALLIGLALGGAGTLFQRVLGNPLASPDFLGVAAGAGTATVAAIVFGASSALLLPTAALAGGALTAALIYLFAWRRGVSAYRFILVGVGVATFAQSITSYLVARAEMRDAREALTWLIGSVGMASPAALILLAVTMALFVPAGVYASRVLRALELGDATARVLGSRTQRDRVAVLGIGVVLVAVATAAAGPIAFIAMLAGPLARLLLRRAGQSIAASALMGAVLLQTADLLAQHALPWPVSTGVVTGVFGAPYIAWVLISAARRSDLR